MSNMASVQRFGQSIWLDFIDRNLLVNGGLEALVGEGLRGVTSNPTIFCKAITGTGDYDEAILDLLQADHEIDGAHLFEWLSIQDGQQAADILHPVYEQSAGLDGYVSLEVSPHLARDTRGTIEAARHLWKAVHRPNLMIKVPATAEGLPAIEQLIADGINVNATLLFSVRRYEQVFQAYARGLAASERPGAVASVASFFISRIDAKVDPLLDAIGSAEAKALRGRTAIASAKLAYGRFKAMADEPGLRRLLERGARVQRLLWGSTSTKDPRYPDTLYVDALIGPATVNTLPPATLDAFQAHGELRATLEQDEDRAARDLEALARLGVDLETVTDDLEREGVQSFTEAYDYLLRNLEEKRAAVAMDYAGR